jgi:hypothetical protein
MTVKPLYVPQSTEELFGSEYYKYLQPHEVEMLDDVLNDGVIDQSDFDHYSRCDQNACERDEKRDNAFACAQFFHCDIDYEHFANSWGPLFRTYFYLSRFSQQDVFKNRVSGYEALLFQAWVSETNFDQAAYDPQKYGLNFYNKDRIMYDDFSKNYYITEPIDVMDNKMLLVVHPTSTYDEQCEARDGADKEVAMARQAGVPVYYLAEHQEDLYLSDVQGVFIESEIGEHEIRFHGDTIILMGGYLTRCLRTTLFDLLDNLGPERRMVTIEMPMVSIYMGICDEHIDAVQNITDVVHEAPLVVTLKSFLEGKKEPEKQIEMYCKQLNKETGQKYNIDYIYEDGDNSIRKELIKNKKATITLTFYFR